MKLFVFALTFQSTFSSFAKDIDCVNQSLFWQEDSLSLDIRTMSGVYFDNDTNRELVCDENEENYIYCHEKGGENELRTRISPSGEAIVLYSPEQWVDFSCDL